LFNGSSAISDEPFFISSDVFFEREESLIDSGVVICDNENGSCEELVGFDVRCISRGAILFIRILFSRRRRI
jgi:hypothetical protein